MIMLIINICFKCKILYLYAKAIQNKLDVYAYLALLKNFLTIEAKISINLTMEANISINLPKEEKIRIN